MNNTVQIAIATDDEQVREQLIAQLSVKDFDAFEEKEHELICFIEEKNIIRLFLKIFFLNIM